MLKHHLVFAVISSNRQKVTLTICFILWCEGQMEMLRSGDMQYLYISNLVLLLSHYILILQISHCKDHSCGSTSHNRKEYPTPKVDRSINRSINQSTFTKGLQMLCTIRRKQTEPSRAIKVRQWPGKTPCR